VRVRSRLLALCLILVMVLSVTPMTTISSAPIGGIIGDVPLSLDVPMAVMSERTLTTSAPTSGGWVAIPDVAVQAGAFLLTLTSIGTTSGSGTHPQGAIVQVTTTVPTGQAFVSWTNGAQVVSTSPSFNFTMPGSNTTLVANFRPTGSVAPTEVVRLRVPLYVIGGTHQVTGFINFATQLHSIHGNVGILGGWRLVGDLGGNLAAIRGSNSILLFPPTPAGLQEFRDLANSHPDLSPLAWVELEALLQFHPLPLMFFSRDGRTGMVRGLIIADRVDAGLADMLSTELVPLDVTVGALQAVPHEAKRINELEVTLPEKAKQIQALEAVLAEMTKQIKVLETALHDLALGKRAVTEKSVVRAVDPYSPSIDLAALGIPIAMVDAFKLEKKGDQTGIPLVFTLADNRVFIGRTGTAEERVIYGWNTRFIGFAGGSNILELYQEYLLKVYTIAGQTYRISFKTSGLPALANDSTARQIILIPAMPEKGFYWPYLLAIPDTSNRASNVRHRRYLLVDGNNTGATNRFPETIAATKRFVSNRGFKAVRTADALWSPLLVPVFPRPKVGYSFWGEHNIILTHSFDRDTAILHLKMQDPNLRPMLIREFADANFNVHHLERLDLQLIAMIDHALEYLNKHQFNLEPAKVFMYGYSASGTFVDRFATLHPERVRAVSSGATLDDMILPLAQYRGRNLIFPIGVYDYERITGRQFSLARHNQVARLIHMGELDTFNVLPYGDCYGDHERQIITELWGVEILPRARKLIELYGQSGGKGMFILDRGQGHSESHAMQEYIIEFFKANRDSDVPVYPLPRDPAQLMYTLFR